jgi:hypothetical protein
MSYKRGIEYPNEGFVQAAIEKHFQAAQVVPGGTADFACIDADGNRWLIEAKGMTTAVGLDFRTGLGQLVQAWADIECRYALAMPDLSQFATQRGRVSDELRQRLNLWWLVVSPDGAVESLAPDQPG